jgi:hypothetical protein
MPLMPRQDLTAEMGRDDIVDERAVDPADPLGNNWIRPRMAPYLPEPVEQPRPSTGSRKHGANNRASPITWTARLQSSHTSALGDVRFGD